MILRIRENLSFTRTAVLSAAFVVVVFLLWVVLTAGSFENRLVSGLILPSPWEVLAGLKPLHLQQGLTRSIVSSLGRVTLGFAVSVAVAFPLGILIGSFTKARAFFQPLVVASGYVPVAALLPLCILLFGTAEKQKVMFIAIASFVVVLPLIVRAFERVDDVYLQTGYTLGATRWQTIFYVLLPVALVEIYQSLRVVYSVGWGYIVLAENVDMENGLGGLIWIGQRRGHPEWVFACLFIIVLIALGIDAGLKQVGNWLFPYALEE